MRIFATILLFFVGLVAPGPSANAAAQQQIHRYALLVGANDGGADRVKLRFAGSDATAMKQVFTDIGGVDPMQQQVLLDPSVTELAAAFEGLGQTIAQHSEPGVTTQFFFYYSGHSDEQGLLLGGTRVGYQDLRTLIAAVPADVNIGILDSCASGALTRLKGGTHLEPFLSDASSVTGHAYLTSSTADEAAQESDRVGGSFFTHYLVTGLRGGADDNRDGKVTLNEAYRFAYDETLARTETTQGGAQHPGFDIRLVGTGDLVMTDLRETSGRLEIAASVDGRVYVRNAAGQLAAELYKPAGSEAVILALEPGVYQIVVEQQGELWRTELELPEGGVAALVRSEMITMVAEPTVARGDAPPPEVLAIPVTSGEPVEVTRTEDEYQTIGFTTGIVPPLHVNSVARDRKVINHFGLHLAWGHAAKLDGFSLSAGGASLSESMEGVQISAGVNVVDGPGRGFQNSAGLNVARSFEGAQIVGGVNVAREHLEGLQLAAGLNAVGGPVDGAQIGTVNTSKDLKGIQLGVINVAAGRVKGIQFGVINVADDADASVGVIGISRKHGVGLNVWTSDIAAVNLGARFHTRFTYTVLSVGLHPSGDTGHFMYGAGIGVHGRMSKAVSLDFDITSYGVHGWATFDKSPPALIVSERLTLGVKVAPAVRIFGGASFNQLWAWDACTSPSRPGYPYISYERELEDGFLRLWPGFALGIEINPAPES